MPRSWRMEQLVSEPWIRKDVKERKRRGITMMWLRTTTKKLGHNSWRSSRVSKGDLPTQIKTLYRLIEFIHRFSTVVNEFLFTLCLFNGVLSYHTIYRRITAQSAYTESDRLQEEAVVPLHWPTLKPITPLTLRGWRTASERVLTTAGPWDEIWTAALLPKRPRHSLSRN